MEAKIVSYDSSSGKGILITKENEKIDFSIDKWDDFNVLPNIGLLVEINENNSISPKKDLDKENLIELKTIINDYINNSVAKGWKVINNGETGFVIEETTFSFFICIILLIVLSFLLGFLFGIFAPIIALPFSIWFARTKQILKGEIDYKYFQVNIYDRGVFMDKLTLKKKN